MLESLAADPEAGLLGEKARSRLGGAPGPAPAATAPVAPHPAGQLAAAPAPFTAPSPRPAPGLAPSPPFGTTGPRPGAVDWEPDAPVEEVVATRRAVTIEECTIDRLDEGGLVVRGADGTVDRMLYAQVEAVAVAGISATPKPFLLVDLVLSPGPAGARTILRLASTRLDPRQLIGMPTLPPMQAFRELVEKLVVASGARLLPAPEALVQIAMFPDPDAYQRSVLADFL